MWRIALILTIITLLLIIPIGAGASSSQVVVITAQPDQGNITCPWNFSITAVSLYEIQLSWNNAVSATGAMVRGAYGRWPGNVTDGFEVYHGNLTTITHWVNTEFIGVDVYYRIYSEYGNGTYTTCYVSGSVTGGKDVANIAGGITLFALIVFALGCTISSYAFRKITIAVTGVAAWAALAFYSFTQSSSSSPADITDYWMAIFWVGIGMVIIGMFESFSMRESPVDTTPAEEARSQADEMRDEYAAMQKEMGVGIFKSKKKKRKGLPKSW
jgi:hypothetical protein